MAIKKIGITLEKLIVIVFVISAFFIRVYELGKMNLFQDEAYYWDWSRHLSIGYFPHPPMVSYFIYIGKHLFGETEFGIRLPFAIAGTLAILVIYKLTKEMFSSDIAIMSVLTVAASPPFVLFSRLATPDTIVFLFWALCTLFFWRAYKYNDKSNYYLFGIFLGFALLSKYQSYFLIVTVISFLLIANKGLNFFKNRNFYVGLFLALLIFSPNIFWNAVHHWVTYIFLYKNGMNLSFPAGISLEAIFSNVLSWLRDSATSYDPLMLLAITLSLPVFIYYGIFKKNDAVKFCFSIFLPITLFFSIFSGHKHWAFPGLFSAYIILTYFLNKIVKHKMVLYSLISLILITNIFSIFYLIQTISSVHLDPRITNKSYVSLHDYTYLEKEDIHTIAQQINYQINQQTLITEDYTLSSQMAFYLTGRPQTYALNGQYLLWGQPDRWANVIVFANEKSLFKGVTPKEIKTQNRLFYYYDYGNNKPDLAKDWTIHFEGP